eukprot:COSAG01_NODE_41323_length_453_cov_0.725989_1_plen_91_part_10
MPLPLLVAGAYGAGALAAGAAAAQLRKHLARLAAGPSGNPLRDPDSSFAALRDGEAELSRHSRGALVTVSGRGAGGDHRSLYDCVSVTSQR